MSRLKIKLLEKLSEFSRQAKSLKDQEARSRWFKLRFIVKSQLSVRRACLKAEVSEEWFRKWARRLLDGSEVSSLQSQSRRPLKSPRRLKRLWQERVLMIRRSLPFEGCERVSDRIYDVYKKKISPGAIHKVLVRNGLVDRSKAKRLTKKHMKRYRRWMPGFLQMDFKYVPYKIRGRQYYQLSCVDHHSSWRLIRIYDNKSFLAVESFLAELALECPFPILEIQTDNDLAFTHKFWKLNMGFDPTNKHPLEEWCDENEIRHKLIPVGEKELNGKVENTHKQDDREFYSQIQPQNLNHLQALSLVYEKRWNEQRKTRALGRKTPNESLWDGLVRTTAWAMLMGIKPPKTVLKIPKPKKVKTTTKKRKTQFDRFMTWVKEDAKKYGNG